VKEAAGLLIQSLIKLGDLSNAERFAEQTYANLRDIKNGIDQEGEIVANGAFNFADVIFQQDDGDLIKAEGLARKSLRIRDKLHAAHSRMGGVNILLLAKILRKQGKFGDETKKLFERSLAICVRNKGLDGDNTAVANTEIYQFYYMFAMMSGHCRTGHTRRMQPLLAKSYSDEAIRIETKIHNSNHPNSIAAAFFVDNLT
jgi:hypothetical protein